MGLIFAQRIGVKIQLTVAKVVLAVRACPLLYVNVVCKCRNNVSFKIVPR
jgi:hypothetical protein